MCHDFWGAAIVCVLLLVLLVNCKVALKVLDVYSPRIALFILPACFCNFFTVTKYFCNDHVVACA